MSYFSRFILKLTNKKDLGKSQNLFYGADYWALLELFNKTLQPVLSSPQIIILYSEIENYINGIEN